MRLTGLASKETIVALDVRPNSGQLYGLSSASKIYVIHPASGTARSVGAAFTPALEGRSFGLDVNPVADQIRAVSDSGQNLRFDPDSGRVTGVGGRLAYKAGDPGAGRAPVVTGAAYTDTSAPPGGTQLFVVDTARDVLALQDPPDGGALSTVGPLGLNLQDPVGFDIAGDGRAFLSAGRSGNVSLYLVDLRTGRATPASEEISNRVGNRGQSGSQVRAIAAAGDVPDDTTRPALLLNVGNRDALARLRRTFTIAFSCSEWCRVDATLSARLVVRATDAGGNVSRVRQNVQLG